MEVAGMGSSFQRGRLGSDLMLDSFIEMGAI